MLVDIEDKDNILIVGDIHGDFTQFKRAIHYLITENIDYLIFDGDIIDKGPEMMECIISLMCLQLFENYEDKILFLRGNHELKSINELYGFRGYCTSLFGSKTYLAFCKAFGELPLAGKIDDWGFVTHGGIPRETIYFHLMRLEPKISEPKEGPYYELMWNDPDDELNTFSPSFRGENIYQFGKEVFDEFMEFHDLEMFFRAHQAFPQGFKWFFDKQLLSIFSSRAGPYHNINPHFARINKKDVKLIPCEDIKLENQFEI